MASFNLANLMDPLIKLRDHMEKQSEKLDDMVKAVAVGRGGRGIKNLDKEILEELKKQTTLLEGIANKTADPLTAVKANLMKAKGEVEKLTEGGKALAALGVGAKELGIGLLVLSLVPDRVMTKFTNFIVGIASAFDQVDVEKLQKGGDAINNMGEAIWNFTKKIAFSSLLILPFIPVLPILMLTVWGISWVVSKVGQMKGIKKGSKAIKDIGNGLIGFGLGITALAIASLIIIAKPMILPVMALTLILIGGAIALLGLVAGPLKRGSKALKDTGIGLASFAIGVGVFALVATFIPWETIPKMGMILLVVGGVLGIIGVFSKQIKEGSIALAIAGGALVALSIGLLVFNYATASIGAEGYALMAGVLLGIAAIFGLAGYALPYMMAGATALAMAGVALIALSIGLVAFNAAVSSIGSLEEVGMMAAALGGISLAFAAAGVAAVFILPGAIALAVAGVALILLSAGVALFSLVWGMTETKNLFADTAGEQTGIRGGKLTNFEVAINSITYGMAINPITAGFILLGSGALIVASVALMLLSVGVGLFANKYADPNVQKLFAPKPGYTVFGLSDGKLTRTGSEFEFAIESIARSFMLSPVQVGAMYSTAPALIMAGFALSSIADGISDFVKVIDKITDKDGLEGVAKKISTTLTTVSQAFGVIGGTSGGSSKAAKLFGFGGDIPGVDGMYSPDAVKRGIESVSGMGKILVNVAKGVAAFATMRYVDSDGKEIRIGPEEQAKAVENIKMVMTTVPQAFGVIGSSTTSLGRFASSLIAGVTGFSIPTSSEYSAEEVKSGIEAVGGMGEILVNVAAGVKAFAEGTYTDINGNKVQIKPEDLKAGGFIFDNIKAIITSVAGVFGSLGAKNSGFFGTDEYDEDDVKSGIDAVQGMGGILSGVAEFLKAFSESKGVADSEKIKNFLAGIMDAVTQLAVANADKEKTGVEMVEDLFNALGKAGDAAEPLEKVAASINKIKDGINAMETEKLKSTVELMQNINGLKESDAAENLQKVAESLLEVINSMKPKEPAADGTPTAAKPKEPAAAGTPTAAVTLPTSQSESGLGTTLAKLQATLNQINATMANLPADIASIEIKLSQD